MKIAWVTPLGLESAIAEYSIHITRALADVCDVEILASDPGPWRQACVPTAPLTASEASADLRSFDVRVYNMGDHAPYHRAVYEASSKVPGYCVLHDRVYQSLFASMWLGMPAGCDRYEAAMARHYGLEGRQAATDSIRGVRQPVWEDVQEWLRYPFDDELIAGSRGVLVHTDDHRRSIASKWFGPVGRVHYPSYAEEQTVERAASDYLRFFEEARAWGPVLDLADRAGVELRDMGVTTASHSVARIGREIAVLGDV